jgi:hypothetical protein
VGVVVLELLAGHHRLAHFRQLVAVAVLPVMEAPVPVDMVEVDVGEVEIHIKPVEAEAMRVQGQVAQQVVVAVLDRHIVFLEVAYVTVAVAVEEELIQVFQAASVEAEQEEGVFATHQLLPALALPISAAVAVGQAVELVEPAVAALSSSAIPQVGTHASDHNHKRYLQETR